MAGSGFPTVEVAMAGTLVTVALIAFDPPATVFAATTFVAATDTASFATKGSAFVDAFVRFVEMTVSPEVVDVMA